MELITLNIWGGHSEEELLRFIRNYADVDIFCLQEVYHNALEKISTEDRKVTLDILSKIQAVLKHHKIFFRSTVDGVYGLAICIKNTIKVLAEGEVDIHKNPDYKGRGPAHSRILQWIKCAVNDSDSENNEKICYVMNVHCLWNGMGKTDTPERILQSKNIRMFMEKINEPQILCGDFNLRPDTESIKIIEDNMNNLIKIYGVQSTRTSLYTKEEKFADYIFLSKSINIKDFAVLQDEVSDHSALFLKVML